MRNTDLAPWVYAAVYGSFAAQAAGLLALLILQMRQPQMAPGKLPRRQVLSAGVAVAVGARHLLRAAGGPFFTGDPAALDSVTRLAAAVTGALAFASALSLVMMSKSTAARWVVLGWVASGAMACFSAYLLLINLLSSQQPGPDPRPLLVATLVAGSLTAVAVRTEFDKRLVLRAA